MCSSDLPNSIDILQIVIRSSIVKRSIASPRYYLIADEAGTYDGISASYSGPGFSGMKFKAIATPDRATFDQWVAKAKQSPNSMDSMAAFEKVAVPSEYNKVEYFSNVKPDLFKDVVNKFMSHESMNMSKPEGEHAAHDGMEGMDMSHAETAH